MTRGDKKIPLWIRNIMDNHGQELQEGEYRCSQCGYIISDDAVVCGGCGASLYFESKPHKLNRESLGSDVPRNSQTPLGQYHNTTQNKPPQNDAQDGRRESGV